MPPGWSPRRGRGSWSPAEPYLTGHDIFSCQRIHPALHPDPRLRGEAGGQVVHHDALMIVTRGREGRPWRARGLARVRHRSGAGRTLRSSPSRSAARGLSSPRRAGAAAQISCGQGPCVTALTVPTVTGSVDDPIHKRGETKLADGRHAAPGNPRRGPTRRKRHARHKDVRIDRCSAGYDCCRDAGRCVSGGLCGMRPRLLSPSMRSRH